MSTHRVQRISSAERPDMPPFEWPYGTVTAWTMDWGCYLRLLADGEPVLTVDTRTGECQAVQGSWTLPPWLVTVIQAAIQPPAPAPVHDG